MKNDEESFFHKLVEVREEIESFECASFDRKSCSFLLKLGPEKNDNSRCLPIYGIGKNRFKSLQGIEVFVKFLKS